MSKRGNYLSRTSLIVISICLVTLLGFFSLSYIDLRNITILQSSSDYLTQGDTAVNLLRKSDESLVMAEDHYRLYLNSSDTAYKRLFISDIREAVADLEAVNSLDPMFTKRILQNVNSKLNYYNSIEGLKKVEDSIIRGMDEGGSGIPSAVLDSIRFSKAERSVLQKYISTRTDTVKIVPLRRKGVLGKLKSIFGTEQSKTEYIGGRERGKRYSDSVLRQTNAAMKDLSEQFRLQYHKALNSQLNIQTELSAKEQALAKTNLALVSNINDKIKSLVQQAEAERQSEKSHAILEMDEARSAIKNVRLFSLLSITILIGILIYNVYRTNKYEEAIVMAKVNAEKIAQLKGRFLSNISHEIRSPLTGIMGFTEEIIKGEKNPLKAKYLNAIKVSSDHLLNTVNDILDFSKLEARKLRIVNAPFLLRNAVDEVVLAFSLQAEKKGIYLRAKNDFDADLCLLGDVHRFKQVLYNLVSNAIKFTDKGGIEVVTTVRSLSVSRITATVSVRDTGVGIPTEQLDYIFEEFAQAYSHNIGEHARSIQGTGLGLPICKMLVELQKGGISVKSKPGRGAEFIFDIPYALAKMAAPQGDKKLDAERVNEIKHDNGHKILVVEDNEFNIMLLSVLLGRMGYPFDIVSDGEVALTKFKDGDYGLVITDINLPRMTGLELAELIRKYEDHRKASIPIIVLTADLLVNEYELGKEGINAVVTKPFKEGVLRKHIDDFMAV